MSGVLFKDVLVAFPPYHFQYINAVNHTVDLMDPSKNNSEKADSIHAAQKSGIHFITPKFLNQGVVVGGETYLLIYIH